MRIIDSLRNLVSGLGTAKDKGAQNAFVFNPMSQFELENAYRGDWISRKVIDIVPSDMTREWRSWRADEADNEKLEAAEKALGIRKKTRQANIYGRLYGGGALVMGDGSSFPQEEFRADSIKLGGLKYLHVFNRYELSAGEMERDIASPWFGRPKYYDLSGNSASVRLHPSRVIPFIGAPIPNAMSMGDGWGDSILEATRDAIVNAASAPSHVASLLAEAKIDIMSVPGLSEILSTEEGTKMLTARFGNAAMMKSMFNLLLIDASQQDGGEGETWQQKTLSFGDFPKLIETFLQIAAGAADIPVTRLLGQSPAGLSATGDSDIRNYYDHVSARQENDLRPALEPLDEALIRHALGTRPDGIFYDFEPLWQLGDKEKAEVAKLAADTAVAYATARLIPTDVLAEGVKSRLIDDGTFPGIEAAYDEFGGTLDDPAAEEQEAALLPAPATVTRMQAAANDAAPRTLYVRRNVLNAASVLAWAKAQGFETTLTADDLHVTIAFSKAPVDWMATGESWQSELKVAAGGPRLMEQFGKATVLLFTASELRWRHEAFKEAGASWDHPEFQPHITISYGFTGDLSKIEPYQGEIVLGPELFEEVKLDWEIGIKES